MTRPQHGIGLPKLRTRFYCPGARFSELKARKVRKQLHRGRWISKDQPVYRWFIECPACKGLYTPRIKPDGTWRVPAHKARIRS